MPMSQPMHEGSDYLQCILSLFEHLIFRNGKGQPNLPVMLTFKPIPKSINDSNIIRPKRIPFKKKIISSAVKQNESISERFLVLHCKDLLPR